jgi:hypothetical protein
MLRKIGGVLLAGVILLAIFTINNELSQTVEATSKSADITFWVYQITEIDGTGNGVDYYGTNNQYGDFPQVYFTNEELNGQVVNEGEWVVTVFENDDLVDVIKIR